MSEVHNKLVRDKIPDIIKASGKRAITVTLNETEYLVSLTNKLREELNEFEEGFFPEELADIQEVVYALRDAIGLTPERLEELRAAKAERNGAFKDRIFLEEVIDG